MNDTHIGLMRDISVHILDGEPMSRERFSCHFFQRLNRNLIGFISLHLKKLRVLPTTFSRWRHGGAAARHTDELA